MTSLLKKLSISIKIGVFKRHGVCLASFQIVDRIRRQSSTRRELVANCAHTADADATKQFRRVGVGGVYWALANSVCWDILDSKSESAQWRIWHFGNGKAFSVAAKATIGCGI